LRNPWDTLVQDFGQIVRKREGHRLSDWKQQVTESGFLELPRFAKGLERDREAVVADLTESYSNGMTEGFVNKLKLIKGQGYGRASFPLLRQRMPHILEGFSQQTKGQSKHDRTEICIEKKNLANRRRWGNWFRLFPCYCLELPLPPGRSAGPFPHPGPLRRT
jgi:hypothetical protein